MWGSRSRFIISKLPHFLFLLFVFGLISKSFQALRCVIKVRDPRLQRINVATPSFLTIGPIPESTLTTDPIPEGIPKVALPSQRAVEEEATSSQPSTKGEEGVVIVFDFEDYGDDFEVFNHPLSPDTPSGDLSHHFLKQASQVEGYGYTTQAQSGSSISYGVPS